MKKIICRKCGERSYYRAKRAIWRTELCDAEGNILSYEDDPYQQGSPKCPICGKKVDIISEENDVQNK